MSENDTTITISRVPTTEGDRVLIRIDSESGLGDFARIYLHPETAYRLRAELLESANASGFDHVLFTAPAIPARPESHDCTTPTPRSARQHFADLGYRTEPA